MKKTMQSIMSLLNQSEQAIFGHAISTYITMEMLPKNELDTVIKCFYADSLWWVAALRYMYTSARNDRFKQALLDNIRCETGEDGGTPHVTMIERFVESIGLKIDMKDQVYVDAVSRAQDENRMLKRATEPQRAGFMFATEALFPIVLKVIRPAIILQYPDADMEYIDVHIEVDADEHSQWMKESVEQILASSEDTFDEIVAGMQEALHGAIYPFDKALGQGLVVRL